MRWESLKFCYLVWLILEILWYISIDVFHWCIWNCCMSWAAMFINTLRLRQNGCHFTDDIFKCIFLNENVWILIKISLNCIPKGRINNIPSLVQIMAWHQWGDKPLSESMMDSLLINWPQWGKPSVCKHIKALTKWTTFCRLFPNAFSWETICVSWLKFYWSLFWRCQFRIRHHWIWQWLSTCLVPNHYLNQCWLIINSMGQFNKDITQVL